MASITFTAASFLCSKATASQSHLVSRRRLVVANAARETEVEKEKLNGDKKQKDSNGRRDLVFAAAAATVCSVARIAAADEPKRGSAEAKKVYASVCASNPTARICRG